MADVGFDIAPLFPHTICVEIDDPVRVLLSLRNSDTFLPLTIPLPQEPVVIESHLYVRNLPEISNGGPPPAIPHDTSRTAAEVLIAAEVFRRLHIFLSDYIRNTLEGNDIGVHENAASTKQVLNYFDLTNTAWNDVLVPPAFNVAEISFDSPSRIKATIRTLVVVVNVAGPAPAVVAPPVSSAVVGNGIAVAALAVSGAQLGFTIKYQRNDGAVQQGHIKQQLEDQLKIGNIRGVQANLGTLGYYRGAIDNIHGPLTKSAISSFAEAHGLNVDIKIDDPTFLLRLSEEVIKL